MATSSTDYCNFDAHGTLRRGRMSRGQYWQVTYDSNGSVPTEKVDLASLRNSAGPANSIILAATSLPATINKHFQGCDFREQYSKLTFRQCEFDRCDFDHGEWQDVKFSDCTFRNCNVSITKFVECVFLDCKYDKISVSAEHLRFEKTSISASPFLKAVTTNIANLPADVEEKHQILRLRITTHKVARTIFSSTKDEPDRQLYFEAHKEYMLRQFPADRAELEIGNASFLSGRIALSYLDEWLTRTAGTLTDWGRSLLRPTFFGICLVFSFAAIYALFPPSAYNPDSFWGCLAKSIDVTVLVGYTRYNDGGWLKMVALVHLLLGLYWYALVVPVFVRRMMR